QTAFPMRGDLPKREPDLLARWQKMNLFARLREGSKGREKYILHDGPPYANGNIHIGTGLNKILKDFINRVHQMRGCDAHYVPGWDCHGLPIEWKIEEEYRAKGKDKDKVPIVEFRRECREFAEKWITVQRDEFKRLGVEGDWENYYSTMSYQAEAQIVRELGKFAVNGGLYRGSRPVMWSVVEKTALAEAEIEYHDHTSDTVHVRFPVLTSKGGKLDGASIVIWTTTPWTMPGNRALAFGPDIAYALVEVVEAGEGSRAKAGEKMVLAKELVDAVAEAAKFTPKVLGDVAPEDFDGLVAAHPLRGQGYDFDVRLLPGSFVTADAGTGFVHIAPGHGADDYELGVANGVEVPDTVAEDGSYYPHVPLFAGKKVYTAQGVRGDANRAVSDALDKAGKLLAFGRIRHSYPHSWRSKAPVIFRNAPQWFIAMDKPIAEIGGTLREKALAAIDATRFVPRAGYNRLRSMIEQRPDWCVSRQRAWGVPITVFVNKATGEPLRDPEVMGRVVEAFKAEGADVWFESPPERFLGNKYKAEDFEQVTDILDVWFDSGSTHVFTLEGNPELKWPADLYLEGSDQHRGWFHSSLLESCGTRGRAPFDIVLTHGFVLDERGQKMSKSLGNVVAPQDVIKESGADILRLWVAASDYSDDLRIGKEILKTFVETYRKLRNTIRWMLGALAHHRPGEEVEAAEMPELERLMLHRLAELDGGLRDAYAAFDYKRVVALLTHFMTSDLSAFYFDIRKDALYCDPLSSARRRAALATIDTICDAVLKWLAPILVFTAEEAWLAYRPDGAPSIHLTGFPEGLARHRDDALAARWETVRRVRRVVTGALEIERAAKRIGASLEAAPRVYVADESVRAALDGLDFAEICITSGIEVLPGEGPADAFRLDEVRGVAVVPALAQGRKCARSWKVTPDVGSDPAYPDVTPRDAQALREWEQARG
ncbi:MAG TPA: isoleucine--tRNA ligase, partial [Salinarimonas sp.]|nr:isoleucine--tRNA ligase [Salinarimonas sp.]